MYGRTMSSSGLTVLKQLTPRTLTLLVGHGVSYIIVFFTTMKLGLTPTLTHAKYRSEWALMASLR